MAISWDDDVVDGGKTSVQILVDWLITPGNYERWRKAGLTGPVTKTSLWKKWFQSLFRTVKSLNKGILDADNALLANYQLVLYTGNPSEMISEASFVSLQLLRQTPRQVSATLETLPTHPFQCSTCSGTDSELNTAQLPELIPAHVSIQNHLQLKSHFQYLDPRQKSKSTARKVRSNAFPFPLIDAEDESDEISDTANDDNDEDWASLSLC
ncbi:hypothetical protein BSLG_005944 [Batrachochytrium salamandrivorans]|nr:hypothetical protein BSLG_005944 [Batrachochytrium salamandrivorans]